MRDALRRALMLAGLACAVPGVIRASLAAEGDPVRGRAVVVDRQVGMCLLCHSGPFPEERFQGDLAPDLDGVGARLSAQDLRRRLVDPRAFNPASIMPSFSRTEGLWRVAPARRGRPLLTPQQIEDVVAFLATLR